MMSDGGDQSVRTSDDDVYNSMSSEESFVCLGGEVSYDDGEIDCSTIYIGNKEEHKTAGPAFLEHNSILTNNTKNTKIDSDKSVATEIIASVQTFDRTSSVDNKNPNDGTNTNRDVLEDNGNKEMAAKDLSSEKKISDGGAKLDKEISEKKGRKEICLNTYEAEKAASDKLKEERSPQNVDKKIEVTNKSYIKSDVDLLLLGKTGYGKSSTGNVILGHSYFKTDDSFQSVTTQVDHAYCKIGSRVIKIVDAPGILDTDHMNDIDKMTTDVTDKMQDAVRKHTEGYHAFLIVLKYGVRFTKEDVTVITILKNVFGENIVKHYCILILTHGDIYRKKNNDKKFKTWCLQQSGEFAELYKECGKRAVLFNNQTTDENIIDKQCQKLLKIIDNLQYHGRRYCDDHFKAAEVGRQRMLLECKAPKIIEEIKVQCNICMKKINELITQDPEKQYVEFVHMSSNIALIKDDTEKQDNNYGVLTSALESLSQLDTMIKTSIEKAKFSIEKKDMEEEKAQLTKEYNKKIEQLTINVQLSKEEKNKLSAEIAESERKLEDFQKTIEEKEQQVKDTESKREEDKKKVKEQFEKMMEAMRKSQEELIQRNEEYAKKIETFQNKTSTFGKRLNYACNPQ